MVGVRPWSKSKKLSLLKRTASVVFQRDLYGTAFRPTVADLAGCVLKALKAFSRTDVAERATVAAAIVIEKDKYQKIWMPDETNYAWTWTTKHHVYMCARNGLESPLRCRLQWLC
jgi:hypothetical protein